MGRDRGAGELMIKRNGNWKIVIGNLLTRKVL